jgi:hypothetical protein
MGAVLLGAGLAALGAGVAYWWQDWAFATLVLGFGLAAGLFLVGGGVLLSWPGSPAACLTASLSLVSSAVVVLALALLHPFLPALPAVAGGIGALAVASYVGYLVNRRRARARAAPPPADPK